MPTPKQPPPSADYRSWLRLRDDLMHRFPGRGALFRGGVLVGIFENRHEAFDAGRASFQLGGFTAFAIPLPPPPPRDDYQHHPHESDL